MENLPNELLSEILGFVHPVYDGLIKLSTVCHRWNEIIHKTPSLWEHFHLKLVQLTKQEKNITFRCLREYNVFIKCLRVPALHVVFGYDYWFFIRIVTLEMTNITCLDVPSDPSMEPPTVCGLKKRRESKRIKPLLFLGFVRHRMDPVLQSASVIN